MNNFVKQEKIDNYINKVHCADCLKIFKDIPGESIDGIFTDPPYMISSEIVIARSSNYKYKGKDISQDYGDWDKQWTNKEEYLTWCKIWLKECIRILKPYRHLVFFFDKAKISYVWDYLEERGMKMRSPLFWIKTNPVPRARKVDFMKATEMMIWATKNKVKQEYFNWQLGQHPEYFEHCIVGHTTKADGERVHSAQKPIALMKWLISYLSKSNDIILDPFIGSGTTALAAIDLGRRFIGVEKDEGYYKIAKQNIENNLAQERMF